MANLDKDGTIFVGKSIKPEVLTLAFANRHGLITGATGTGKTVTLQVLAEGLSRAGVSVFAADVKGDLSGVSEVGEARARGQSHVAASDHGHFLCHDVNSFTRRSRGS